MRTVANAKQEISELKRPQALERLVRRAAGSAKAAPRSTPRRRWLRFSARAWPRPCALGLSAAEVGVLLGTSAQSIYNWEQGKSRPRASHLPAIAALRNLGKRQAAAVIASRSGTPADIAA